MNSAMKPFLATAAKALRESRGIKVRHIAERLDVDKSTVYRFEDPAVPSWPRNTDRFIEVYTSLAEAEPKLLWEDAFTRLMEGHAEKRR